MRWRIVEGWAISFSDTYQPSPSNIGQIAAPGSGSLLNVNYMLFVFLNQPPMGQDWMGVRLAARAVPNWLRALSVYVCFVLCRRIRNFVVTF